MFASLALNLASFTRAVTRLQLYKRHLDARVFSSHSHMMAQYPAMTEAGKPGWTEVFEKELKENPKETSGCHGLDLA